MQKETEEAKGQVLEHFRKHPLEVKIGWKGQLKFFEMRISRILEQQIKHETQVTSFISAGKTQKS
jgi:late competence protein required for DNA uptake (superfamily II DNA/RNA helicase)